MKKLVLIVLLPVALLLCMGTGSAQARTSCNAPTHIGRDRTNLGELETNGLACTYARSAIAGGHLSRGGNLLTTNGFRCHVTHRFHAGGVTLGAEVSCRRGLGQFSFSWAS
jgi:hypothetical protein